MKLNISKLILSSVLLILGFSDFASASTDPEVMSCKMSTAVLAPSGQPDQRYKYLYRLHYFQNRKTKKINLNRFVLYRENGIVLLG